MAELEKSTRSFIIRVWMEEDSETGWRGHVRHVLTNEKFHFQTFERLMEILHIFFDFPEQRLDE